MLILKYRENHPDYRNLVKVAQNCWVDHIPLYEHGIGEKVIEEK